jgi:hypothetical protein
VRSVFVQWSLLEREGERPLADLARWTTIDTIELSHVYLVWGPGDPSTEPAPLALPPAPGLGGALPTLDEEQFERLRRLLCLVREQGFAVACNLSPLFLASEELRELSCVDVSGARVPGLHPRLPVYGCPAQPEVVRLGEAMARAFVETWQPLDAVGLNHLEYTVWPQTTVRELFTCFCDACRGLAAARGLDFERVRAGVASLHESLAGGSLERVSAAALLAYLTDRPELLDWLRLRRDAVSAYAERVVSALRGAGTARVGLEFQLPTLAPLVGTDYRRLAPLFDWMTPKFPDYLAGSVVPSVADGRPQARAALRELLELGEEPAGVVPVADPVEGLLYAGAFRPDVIARQRRYVEGRVGGKPIHPYLWLYGGDLSGLREKLAFVRDAGWDGFLLWCWDSDLTTEALRAAHGTL